MIREDAFIADLIRRTEARLAHQVRVVADLTPGDTSRPAIHACDVMASISAKVVSLKRKREVLHADAGSARRWRTTSALRV